MGMKPGMKAVKLFIRVFTPLLDKLPYIYIYIYTTCMSGAWGVCANLFYFVGTTSYNERLHPNYILLSPQILKVNLELVVT